MKKLLLSTGFFSAILFAVFVRAGTVITDPGVTDVIPAGYYASDESFRNFTGRDFVDGTTFGAHTSAFNTVSDNFDSYTSSNNAAVAGKVSQSAFDAYTGNVNAETLDGRDSTAFFLQSSFDTYTGSVNADTLDGNDSTYFAVQTEFANHTGDLNTLRSSYSSYSTTTAPNRFADVSGDTFTGQVNFTTYSTTGNAQIGGTLDVNSSARVGTNLGVGRSPTENLDVYGSGAVDVLIESSNSYAELGIVSTGNNPFFIWQDAGADTTYIDVGGTSPAMIVKSSGLTFTAGYGSTPPIDNSTMSTNGSFAAQIDTAVDPQSNFGTGDGSFTSDITTGVSTINYDLPASASVKGRIYATRKADSGTGKVIVDPNSTELINGVSTIDLTLKDEAMIYQADGTGWKSIGYYNPLLKPVFSVVSSTSYTVTGVNEIISCYTANGNVTLNLPTAVGVAGYGPRIKKTHASNKCYVDGNGAQTVEGFANYSGLDTNGEAISLISNNANFLIFGSY